MSYFLGVDVGTTYTAAAVHRHGRTATVDLGNRSAAIPTVVFLREDETILTGEAANRRGATEPGRVAREFKRRVGDTAPILLGGSPYSADALVSKLLRWVVDAVAEREGGQADRIAVTYPANWGPYKQDLLHQAVARADLDHVVTITEPEAAVTWYASQERVEAGSTVAVYDLGGGTFDAAVVRKTADGVELLGSPEGIERLGGIDFDEAVFSHVAAALGGALDRLDPDDPAAVAAVVRLRDECVEAKEALSADTEVSIPVLLPDTTAEVRLTRAELEAMIRPPLADSLTALRRALRSASIEPDDLDAVLLAGGSSRIPLVAQLVGGELARPVAVDTHPKHAVALGAAQAAAEVLGDADGRAGAAPVGTVHARWPRPGALAPGAVASAPSPSAGTAPPPPPPAASRATPAPQGAAYPPPPSGQGAPLPPPPSAQDASPLTPPASRPTPSPDDAEPNAPSSAASGAGSSAPSPQPPQSDKPSPAPSPSRAGLAAAAAVGAAGGQAAAALVGSTDGGMRGPGNAPAVGTPAGSDRSPSDAAPGAPPAAPDGDAEPRSRHDSGEHGANRPSAKPPTTGPQPDVRRVTVNPGSPPPRTATSPVVPTPSGPAHLPAPARPGRDDARGPRRARPAQGPGGLQWRTVIAVVVVVLVLAGAAIAAVVLSGGDYGAGGGPADSASQPDTTAASAAEATGLATRAEPLVVSARS